MSETKGEIELFVRCGERFSPPGGQWQVLTLPHPLGPDDLKGAVEQVRERLRGAGEARLLIAGPVVLGVALGQGLAHLPTRVVYLQLNQATKQFEEWARNDVDW